MGAGVDDGIVLGVVLKGDGKRIFFIYMSFSLDGVRVIDFGGGGGANVFLDVREDGAGVFLSFWMKILIVFPVGPLRL